MNDLKTRIFLVVTVLGLAVDQVTKYLVRANLDLHTEEIKIIPHFFSIVHAENTAAAFGVLGGFEYRMVVFGIFTVAALGVIFDLFRKLPGNDRFMAITLGLIMSGALGNAIDRIHRQSVTDFLRVYTDYPPLRTWLVQTFGMAEWPSFNVADSALVVGVLLFLVHYLFADEGELAAAEKDAPPPAGDDKGAAQSVGS